tara:strand:- start:13172 stop:13876 length:705 start_codon:yes stop_codon:yes gene_type:complete
MKNKNIICIIPARGGSKRIKNKNIIKFNGKPLISYSIQIAKISKLFKRIIVSTDSVKIKKIALKYGAEVPYLRSKNLSDDYTGTYDVLKDVIKKLKLQNFKYVFCIYPTAPLIKVKDLKSAFKKIKNKKFSSIVATSTYNSNPLRSLKIHKDIISFKWKKYAGKRTQDLKDLIHDSGTFYIYKTEELMKLRLKSIMLKRTSYYNIDRFRAIDINNLEDLKFAEFLHRYKKNNKL